jgi:hypothetical protein
VVVEHLVRGALPAAQRVEDPFAAASGAVAYDLDLEPGGTMRRGVVVALHDAWSGVEDLHRPGGLDAAWARSEARWEERLGRVALEVPSEAAPLIESLRAQLGWILVNRAGVAIQPGCRSYARSWIRDGALTSSALLRLGHLEAAEDFLRWYAPHQYDNGKIPCVVDRRGADPVPEHDSTGEFLHLLTQVQRYGGDGRLLERMWPRVVAGVAYLDSLRALRRTPEFATGAQRLFFGLLPPSISHEGYSAKPMHSYWDDFFALRGYRDAVALAGILGRTGAETSIGASLARFEEDLARSVRAAMEVHRIDYVPGCADLGDFDPTSTTIAFDPTGAADLLPPAALDTTFQRYLDFFEERRSATTWDALTPYELRNVGALVRLGRREEALEVLEWFLTLQRPAGWRQWAEVVARDARRPRFLGDMPHGWVGSDYIRAVLDLFAYEEQDARRLVLAAGVPARWLDAPEGVAVTGLPTPYGILTYTLARERRDLVITFGTGLRAPAGGLVLRPPLPHPPTSLTVDGRAHPLPAAGADLVLERVPARVTYRF